MLPPSKRTHGFILRTRPLTDSSLVVHWLTAEYGRLATVAKGARKIGSIFAGKLDLAFECEFSYQPARRGHLHLLREIRLDNPHSDLRKEYAYLTQIAYAISLIEQTTETDTPIPEIFELFSGFIRHLTLQPAQARNIYAFELKLLTLHGLEPDIVQSSLPDAARPLIERLTQEDWLGIAALKGPKEHVRIIRSFLHDYLTQQWGAVLKGRDSALNADQS